MQESEATTIIRQCASPEKQVYFPDVEIVRYHAAGGIIIDGDRVLLLRKPALGEIVLPKGHIEPGETPQGAAVRETMEEAGYRSLRVVADLGTRQAQFAHAGKWYVRDETYFLMALDDHVHDDTLRYDDAEHDRSTFERLWAPIDAAAGMMSFEPARTFVRQAIERYRQGTATRTA